MPWSDEAPGDADAAPCARCGYEKAEHSYNGACYGICGEYNNALTPAEALAKNRRAMIQAMVEQIMDAYPHADIASIKLYVRAALTGYFDDDKLRRNTNVEG